jgi:transcriptional regulator GlxA family with amidase domain
MARSVNLSESRLQHLFKSETGMSVGEYLFAQRMRKARRLLETTDLSVKQVALEVGARDPSHFIKNYKKYSGHTPRRYRELFHAGALARAEAAV